MHLRVLIGLGLLVGCFMGCSSVNPAVKTPQATATRAPSRHIISTQPAGEVETVFTPQLHSPSYLPAFTQPEAGCSWVGVAGQVMDGESLPVDHVTVVVKGRFNGKEVNQTGISGAEETYGPGGFEIRIGEQAEDTQGELEIQLFDEQNRPVSNAYPLVTYQDCQKNLILYTFQASKTIPNAIFVPFVTR